MSATPTVDYSQLKPGDARQVAAAIARAENFFVYIPSDAFAFIARNHLALRALGALEEAWLDAYVFKSHFADDGLALVKSIFDACDRDTLRALKPVADPVDVAKSGRISLFRGCAGPQHVMGMSWTSSLDKAIWYAAHKAAHFDLPNLAVYAATVSLDEIYCRLTRNEEEFIVLPEKWWKVDVPEQEFRLNRPR